MYVYLGPHRTPHGYWTWNTDYHHIFIYVYAYLGPHKYLHGCKHKLKYEHDVYRCQHRCPHGCYIDLEL